MADLSIEISDTIVDRIDYSESMRVAAEVGGGG